MKLENKTILVTGGAGFIGSHFVELVAQKNKVIVYDNFTSNVLSISDVRSLNPLRDIEIISGDILDQKKLEKSLSGVDIVFHFAVACVRLSLSDESYVHEINATGTLRTLLAAKKAGVKRFVYISSSEVYGTTHGDSIDEHHSIEPQTVYGMSKYMGELYAKHFNDIEKLPTMCIRPFNAYGPREHFDGVYGEVIPRFAIQALSGKQPTIFGDGSQTRDFTYVKDTAMGIAKASECDELLGDVVNIAYGKEVSVATVASLISKQAGLPYNPIYLDARPNDVDRLAANTQKAKKLLAYTPSVTIEEGITIYVSWLKATYPNIDSLLAHIPKTNW